MKEEEPNWFSRWEEELPSPEELTPLSQTLITPDLALAFDIPSPNSTPDYHHHHHHNHAQQQIPNPPPSQSQSQTQQPQLEYDSSELGGGGGMGGAPGDDQARTLKRPRLVWTPQLHKRFVDAVAHLGIKNAVPKTIMQLMNVDGLTRENVASHLQKYRLYLKRMQGLSGGGGGPGGSVGSADTAMDHLFASAPVPHHFLNRGPPPPIGSGGGGGGAGGGPEQFTSFVPVAALQHHQQMAAAAAHQQQQYYQHRHMGHIGSPPGGGFDHGLLTRQPQTGIHRIVGPPGLVMAPPAASVGSYAEEMNSATVAGGGGRKELTLFPTNDD